MEKIWEFFENMHECVYVSDMDTYELIYLNPTAMEALGVKSMDDVAGKKCYEVLRGFSTPCGNCNNEELMPDRFREWQSYSPRLNRYMKWKATMVLWGGRRCRIELAIDISPQGDGGETFGSNQMLEGQVNEAFRLAMQAATPDQSIGIVLEYLDKALRGARTYIFEQNEKGGDDNTYEWVADGVTSEKDHLQDLPPEVCASWYRYFRKRRSILVEDIEELRETDPVKYEMLQNQSIRSIVVVPLFVDGRAIGFYGVDDPSGINLNYASDLLQIMGHFFVSELKRRNLMRELRDMSHRDQLTRIGNRYALNDFMDGLDQDQSIGVAFCDVTGLKRVNDQKGHREGDRLILHSSECLRKFFDDCGLFRVGGDEFIALCPQMEESEFGRRSEELKQYICDNGVTLAVGFSWREACGGEIDRIIAEAEKAMYADKAEYYRRTGIDRRNR